MINYKCTSCGEELEVPDSLCGKHQVCSVCGYQTIVPSSDEGTQALELAAAAVSTRGVKKKAVPRYDFLRIASRILYYYGIICFVIGEVCCILTLIGRPSSMMAFWIIVQAAITIPIICIFILAISEAFRAFRDIAMNSFEQLLATKNSLSQGNCNSTQAHFLVFL